MRAWGSGGMVRRKERRKKEKECTLDKKFMKDGQDVA